ncbi:envelope stress response membrane protein PspB [Erwinia psidii]|uniref:Envelope stress response membrane protein PspB n=1 Tax=Erwinia psidii TaxID=69224 RepID=A0A3N6SLW5_9GAMM|nr:envelope stress response membrane protein PspB [Erwinia psidii]MCX8955989.1 envelope stress response membrane protein PspB [Erwinia psidii]MCX8961361.1 envelope stress response membrane protein PspB [Erwinia psidii]MCX8963793.1 envelope stress response membrane protein PspB [Erwinia psidii]RQM38696.1 envelope stress response membrane protein PspB [Erwinia psidii]
MSALFLAIPLTIFVLFVAPIWLWLHYSNRQNGGNDDLSPAERKRLQQLTTEAARMRERIQALEEILDAEHPNWRQQ